MRSITYELTRFSAFCLDKEIQVEGGGEIKNIHMHIVYTKKRAISKSKAQFLFFWVDSLYRPTIISATTSKIWSVFM